MAPATCCPGTALEIGGDEQRNVGLALQTVEQRRHIARRAAVTHRAAHSEIVDQADPAFDARVVREA